MTRRISVVCVVLVLLGAVPATAQDAALKGVTEAYVVIEDLHDTAAPCGVTEADPTTAATKALLDNGVGVADKPIRMILYVNVNTVYLESARLCVSDVEVELYERLSATPRYSEQPVFGTFILADRAAMNFSGSANHGQRIRDNVFQLVEEIAVDIRLANP